jgi:hypothetical protein
MNVKNGYSVKNDLTAVVESWGYFIEATFNATKYQFTAPALSNDWRAQLEFQTPTSTVSVRFPTSTTSTGWIPFGMLHDLIDVGEPWVTGVLDNVSNYTIKGIFSGYNASATTIQNLRHQILSQNNNNQSTQVNELVSSYGW